MSLRVLETRKRQHIVPILLPDPSTILGYCFTSDWRSTCHVNSNRAPRCSQTCWLECKYKLNQDFAQYIAPFFNSGYAFRIQCTSKLQLQLEFQFLSPITKLKLVLTRVRSSRIMQLMLLSIGGWVGGWVGVKLFSVLDNASSHAYDLYVCCCASQLYRFGSTKTKTG